MRIVTNITSGEMLEDTDFGRHLDDFEDMQFSTKLKAALVITGFAMSAAGFTLAPIIFRYGV